MRWVPLRLENAAEAERQVDEVVRVFTALAAQCSGQGIPPPGGADAEGTLGRLRKTISKRVVQLEQFYREHDLDDRALTFEQQRRRLKRVASEGPQPALQVPPPPPPQDRRAAWFGDARQAESDGRTSSSSGPPPPELPPPDAVARPGVMELRVKLTLAEYQELQVRRDALRRLQVGAGGGKAPLHRGGGALAWDQQPPPPRGESEMQREGLLGPLSDGAWAGPPADHSFRPPVDKSKWMSSSDMRLAALRTKPPQDKDVLLRSGEPHREAPSAGRWSSLHAARTGGANAVDPSRPFRTLVPQTRAGQPRSMGSVR